MQRKKYIYKIWQLSKKISKVSKNLKEFKKANVKLNLKEDIQSVPELYSIYKVNIFKKA